MNNNIILILTYYKWLSSSNKEEFRWHDKLKF